MTKRSRTARIDRPKTKSDAGNRLAPVHQKDIVAEQGSRDATRLGFLIHDVSRMRRTAFDHLMKPLGVTRVQWWVLGYLSRSDGMIQTQLAEALGVGKASLGGFLEKLEESGVIERRDDAIDKRAKRVFMTRDGKRLLKDMMEQEDRFNHSILRDVNQAERETLIELLTRIKKALLREIGEN